MKERFKIMEEKLKELNDSPVSLLDLMVYDEITCQLEDNITDDEFELLFNKTINAYLKADEVNLCDIVSFCIANIDTIRDMNNWDILSRC